MDLKRLKWIVWLVRFIKFWAIVSAFILVISILNSVGDVYENIVGFFLAVITIAICIKYLNSVKERRKK